MAHDKLIHGNQHSQYPKEHKKQAETSKQVDLKMTEDSRIKRERN